MDEMQSRIVAAQTEQVRRELHEIQQACERIQHAAAVQYAVICDLLLTIRKEAKAEHDRLTVDAAL